MLMSDSEFLLLILAGFYFFECAFWIRPGAFVLSSQLGEKHRRFNLGWAFLRNHNGGALLGNLLPVGHSCVCEQWPVSLSPDGAYAYVAQATSSDGRPALSEKFVRYEQIQRVDYQATEIFVNDVLFLRVATASFAKLLTTTIRQLAEAGREKRPAMIDAALHHHFDDHLVAARLRDFRRETVVLRVNCMVLFFLVFVFLPLTLWLQPAVELMPLLLGYFGLVAAIMVQFWAAHRRLHPEFRGERLKHTLLMLISPADAIHARNRLGRTILATFHPLVVSRALAPQCDFHRLAGEVIRDLHFPILPICPLDDPGPRETEEWFRLRHQGVVEQFLLASGFDMELALLQPDAVDAQARSYCPRCLGEYDLVEGCCGSCGDRPLVTLERDVVSRIVPASAASDR